MSRCSHKKALSLMSLAFLAALLLMPLFTFGSGGTSDNSDSTFCISCHAMEAEYEAWFHSGAHKRNMCVDCHLPNENKFSHYLWKSVDGLKDLVVFHSGSVPEQIKISSRGEKTLQANCVRCHEITVMLMDKERKCWSCHRRISHMHTGIMATF